MLQDQKAKFRKTRFEVLEKMLGFNYDMCKALYSPYRNMLNLPASRYTD